MRYPNATLTSLTLALLFCFSQLKSTGAAPTKKANSPPAKTETRQFHFPTAYSLGTLKLMGVERLKTDKLGRSLGPAKGDVSVTVAPESTILLDIDQQSIENPEHLKSLSTAGIAGIDRLKFTFFPLEETKSSVCDVALKTLPEFKNLRTLDVDHSDSTDAGIAGFKSLTSVKDLHVSATSVHGAFLKDPKLKNVEQINFTFNVLNTENLKSIVALSHLNELNLNTCSLTDNDLANLAKCTQLKSLYLYSNPKITDKSIPVLRGLSNLELLDIRSTGITFDGVLNLKMPKLKKIIITVRRYRPTEVEQLTKAFPNAAVDYRGSGVSAEQQVYFAPLK